MRRKILVGPTPDEKREERARPSPFLGYDRDKLGLYALEREMFEVAESQFRRAAYLNPYQPGFLQHLAWSLYKQEKYAEARKHIMEALRKKPDDKDNRYILSRIEEKLARRGQGAV